jgi:transposase-like protein
MVKFICKECKYSSNDESKKVLINELKNEMNIIKAKYNLLLSTSGHTDNHDMLLVSKEYLDSYITSFNIIKAKYKLLEDL